MSEEFVYRVVYRGSPTEEWKQHKSWSSRTGRPYVSERSAKAEAARIRKQYFFRDKDVAVQRAPVFWALMCYAQV